MYSDAFDKVKVIDLESGVPVSIKGWNSVALEIKQPSTGMLTGDLNIKVGNSTNASDVDDPFLTLSNQSIKKVVNKDPNEIGNPHYAYQVEDGLPLSDAEKLADASFKRLILNTMGFSGNKLVGPARNFIMVTGAFAKIRLILARPGDEPQL